MTGFVQLRRAPGYNRPSCFPLSPADFQPRSSGYYLHPTRWHAERKSREYGVQPPRKLLPRRQAHAVCRCGIRPLFQRGNRVVCGFHRRCDLQTSLVCLTSLLVQQTPLTHILVSRGFSSLYSPTPHPTKACCGMTLRGVVHPMSPQ
jgi:hypothetical protein